MADEQARMAPTRPNGSNGVGPTSAEVSLLYARDHPTLGGARRVPPTETQIAGFIQESRVSGPNTKCLLRHFV